MSQYQWNWSVVLEQVSGTEEFYYQWLLSGLGWTITTALSAWVVALLVGSLVGVLRTVPSRWVAGLATAYVELFRNIPLIVQMFLWYFVLPELVPHSTGIWMKQSMPLPEFTTAVVALGFFTSARVAEQVRTGILALPRGQKSAGLALGFTLGQTYRYVLLPMALRIVIPPLTSESMNIIKNSSVAFAVSVAELTLFAMQAQEETSRGIEVYLAVTALYMISAFVINRIMAFIEKKSRIPGFIAAGGSGGH